MSGLPRGWVEATINDVVSDIVGGGTPSKANAHYFVGDIPFMTVKDMNVLYPADTKDKISAEALEQSSAKLIPLGTLVIASRMGLGKVVIPQRDVAINQDLKALFMNGAVREDYLHYRLRERAKSIEQMGTGTTVKGVTLDQIRRVPVPLPPLAEQKRIVAKLDALSAKSARARTELARIETLVSRYKQAVLSKAFGGVVEKKELSELVSRIKAGKNLRCEERPPHQHEKGVVKVSAVTWGEFRADQSKTLPSDFEPEESTRINAGDFLFSRANTIDLVGAVVIVKEAPKNLYLSDKVLRIEFREPVEKWILWYLRSQEGRAALMNISSGNQLSMRNIGQKNLLSLNVPYAEEPIRNEIVRRIESAFAKIDRLAGEAKRALELVGKLDEAILAKAFRGELVPQDENDEPASVLLDRIHAEREGAPKVKRGRGKKAAAKGKIKKLDIGRTAMLTRNDVADDHLERTLKDSGGRASPKELWLKSEMNIDEFYKQLRTEMNSGRILEGSKKDELVLANAR